MHIGVIRRRRTEERLINLNLALRTVREVNKLITTERDRSRLIDRVCRRLTDRSSYECASIMLLDDAGVVELSSHAGGLGSTSPGEDVFAGKSAPPCLLRLLEGKDQLVVTDRRDQCGGCPLSGG